MKEKKAYKQLRKKLKNKFDNPFTDGYPLLGGIIEWVRQCDIKCTADHTTLLIRIYGGGFYPYQKKDRKKILKYLKENKKWDYK